MEFYTIYLAIMLPLQTVEEIYNCNNPNTLGSRTQPTHLCCNWDDEDFEIRIIGNTSYRVLKVNDDEDNYFEKKARAKYWVKNKKFIKRYNANRR